MRSRILLLLGLLAVALPQAAQAQPAQTSLKAKLQYAVKFLCGRTSGVESGAGVVAGHYNTVVNVQAIGDRTLLSYRATALTSDNIDVNLGEPSVFYPIVELGADQGGSFVCGNIKNVLGVQGQDGFVEGFLTIYSDRPLNVSSVLTGQDVFGDNDVTVLEVLEVHPRNVKMKIQVEAPL